MTAGADPSPEPPDWNLLVDRIREGNCVPVLGAAANISSTAGTATYCGLPTGASLAQSLASAAGVDPDPHDKENLSRVALHVEVATERPWLVERLQKELDDTAIEPSPLLHNLARLPIRFFLSTNWDNLMEKALRQRGRKVESFSHLISAKNWETSPIMADLAERFSPTGRRRAVGSTDAVVYKLHGCFRDPETPHVLTVTEDDYVDFILRHGLTQAIPGFLRTRLSEATLLFLGYSLEDVNFRVIYKGLIERLDPAKQRKSYAVQWQPKPFWVKYWVSGTRKIQIYNMDIYDFAEKLLSEYQKRHGAV